MTNVTNKLLLICLATLKAHQGLAIDVTIHGHYGHGCGVCG